MARLRFNRRSRWTNATGNQGVDPLAVVKPTTIEGLCEIVRKAEADQCTARAVGSGHSWSDVALTDGYLVSPGGLNRPLDLEDELLRFTSEGDDRQLVRVEAGMTIQQLNDHLAGLEPSLALGNMGGYDGQTVAGVISTSTHGSGIGYGPLSSFIRSIDLVAAGGVIHRIESEHGPTDPAAYADRYPDRRLEQSDHWFNAVVVGMGCLGLIHSVMLVAQPAYHLREVRSMSTWTQVRRDLAAGDVLGDNAHYEVYVNPYPRHGREVECLVTTRNPIPAAEYRRDHRRARNWLVELTARLPITPWVINLLVGLFPEITPSLLHRALLALVNDDYVNRSYKVLNIGAANYVPAYSAEIGVPVDGRELHLAAVERILEVADQHRRLGSVYHTSPVSLRFVKATDAYMSMMHGCDTMMIELIMVTHTEGGMELLAAYEDALYELGGRPHWGQINSLTGSHDLIAAMYPRYSDWLDIHGRLNSTRVFDSPFSKRVGISARHFAAWRNRAGQSTEATQTTQTTQTTEATQAAQTAQASQASQATQSGQSRPSESAEGGQTRQGW